MLYQWNQKVVVMIMEQLSLYVRWVTLKVQYAGFSL